VVGQHLRAERAREHAREVDHTNAVQGTHGTVLKVPDQRA
jgi:hypothetical protein